MTGPGSDAWVTRVSQARDDLDVWLDQIELMLEEEHDGWSADARDAHEALEEATAYLFDEADMAAMFGAMGSPDCVTHVTATVGCPVCCPCSDHVKARRRQNGETE